MNVLTRVFGWPHELLHVLALILIGRRPKAITQAHVDIPDDLSKWQYVFVAGLPALVFWPLAFVCFQRILNAGDVGALVLWAALSMVALLAAIGTLGDLALIAAFLLDDSQS